MASVLVDGPGTAAVFYPRTRHDLLAVPFTPTKVEQAEAGPVAGGHVEIGRADEVAGCIEGEVGGSNTDWLEEPIVHERPERLGAAAEFVADDSAKQCSTCPDE